jgi:hypothetical protein
MLNELGLSGLSNDVGVVLVIAIWVFALVTFVLWLAVPFILLGIRARLARMIDLQTESLAMAERFIAGFHAANQIREQAVVAPVAVVQPIARQPGETDLDYQARLARRRA